MMIKEDFTFSQDLHRPFCSACMNVHHSLEKCPYIHFIPDPEKIIKTYCFDTFSERSSFPRYNRIKNIFSSI